MRNITEPIDGVAPRMEWKRHHLAECSLTVFVLAVVVCVESVLVACVNDARIYCVRQAEFLPFELYPDARKSRDDVLGKQVSALEKFISTVSLIAS